MITVEVPAGTLVECRVKQATCDLFLFVAVLFNLFLWMMGVPPPGR